MSDITAVLTDNGEPLLEKCLDSLWNQTVRPEIIVCAGPKTNMELATKYADKVIEPVDGIGKARVKGILMASNDYIVSCDADTIYDKRYCEYALEDLKGGINFLRAGTILPHDVVGSITIGEMVLTQIIPYEFSLAFNKNEFIRRGLHERDYSNPRVDISTYLYTDKILVWPDYRMVLWTRLPTYGAEYIRDNYLPGIVLGIMPLTAVGVIIGLDKAFREHLFDFTQYFFKLHKSNDR